MRKAHWLVWLFIALLACTGFFFGLGLGSALGA